MDALELIVDEGRPANAGRFFHLGADLLALLDELSDLPVAWRVDDLRAGSAYATVAPPEALPEEGRVLRLAFDSLAVVSRGGALPDGWSPDAVRVARRFVEHGRPLEGETDWAAPRLRLVTDGEHAGSDIGLTPALGEQLAVLQPFERRMSGSVRGTLVGLNVSRGNRASLKVAGGRVVRVGFDTALRGELKEALYQPVELLGETRQDGDGRIFHVRADEVDVLVRPEVRWTDLFGIDPTFTGGLTIEEFVEVNRGEA